MGRHEFIVLEFLVKLMDYLAKHWECFKTSYRGERLCLSAGKEGGGVLLVDGWVART